MNPNRISYQAAMFGAILAFIAIIFQLISVGQFVSPATPQPYGLSAETVTSGLQDFTESSLLFFAADTLFPLTYLLVFLGLFTATKQRAFAFALMALILGVLTCLIDSAENAMFISLALMDWNGTALPQVDVWLLGLVTTLKWTLAFGTLLFFGLIFPRQTLLEWIITILMILFALFGVLSIAQPALIPFRGLFFLIGMPLFAWYFWTSAAHNLHTSES